MYYRVLGPLEIEDQGRVLSLGGAKQRALLALLLMHANEVVSRDLLIEGLWGARAPPGATHTLEVQISRLRKTMAARGGQAIVTRPTGYQLMVAPEELDLLDFERLVRDGGNALAAGEPGEAANKLGEALALWRGRAFEDVSYESFAQIEIDRLEERRLAAIEERVEADLALDRHADLISELEALVRRFPLRERLRGQLMLALYRSGRQAEALDAYQGARRALVDELGIEPSPALRDLEQAILRQDPALATGGEDRPTTPTLPRPQQLHKTATVLYVETAARSEDGEDDPDELHRVTLSATHELRAAVEYHGGTVERLTGEELLAVFGVPSAHEDDSARAGKTALQLRRALAALDEKVANEAGIRIESRTVIATGEVSIGYEPGSLGLTGAVISFVRRLAETCRPGEILIDSSSVQRAAENFRTERAEPRRLRGDRQASTPLRLLDVVERTAEPEERTPLVGRKQELARLEAAFNRAVAEKRCVVCSVFGDAGIGKSRLAAEVAERAGTEATILVGRCVSYGEGATYLPLREVVAQAVGGRPREAIAGLFGDDADSYLVARQVGSLVEGADGESSTGEAFWAVRRFLERLAHDRPVLIVFEDLHWAEPTLLDLIEYLARWSTNSPLLLLCLARPELVERRPSWLSEFEAQRLEPLAEAETLDLVERVDRTLAPSERKRIAELAGGNPLFVEQLVAYTVEEGPGAAGSIPPSLEGLLSSRLDRLEAPEQAVLQRAAVVGREFWHGAILHLSPTLEVPSVGRGLLELARKGLLEPARSAFPREDAFRFHHVLIRDIAYGSIPPEPRAELHERVADWLDLQSGGHDELVGYHLEQAYRWRIESGPPDRRARRLAADAGDRLAAAGLKAARSGDTPAATGLLTRAIALLSADEGTRRDLLAELGLELWRGGDLDGADVSLQRAVDRAVAAHDRRAELRARVELANFRLFREPEGGAQELLELVATAIPVLEQLGDDRALGRIWYVLAFVHGGLRCCYRESTDAAERALAHFQRTTWPVAPCLQELAASLYYGPVGVPEGISRCRTLLEDADRGGEANIRAFLAGLEAMAGRFEVARELASHARTTYEELSWLVYAATNSATVAADIELLAGQPSAAERILARSCAQLEQWGEHAHLATQATQLGEAVYAQGRFAEALDWSRVAEASAASDDAGAQFLWRSLRAKAVARQGDLEEAEDMAREAVALATATDALSQRAHVQLGLAEALRLRARTDEAAEAVRDAAVLFEEKGNEAGRVRAAALLAELEAG